MDTGIVSKVRTERWLNIAKKEEVKKIKRLEKEL
jgi:hypothetical protein